MCSNCGKSHPGAGCGGHVPPVEHRIKPGEALNPGGRPKGSSVLAPILRKLAAKQNEHGEGAEAERAADAYLAAVRGEVEDADRVVARYADLIERVDGKPRQSISTSGPVAPPTIIVNTHEIRAPEMPE